MTNHFQLLGEKLPTLKSIAVHTGPNSYFAQEALRFRSIAGTLKEIDGFSLDDSANADERHITHILIRPLLESYFWLLYIFDDQNKKHDRYEQLLNSFKSDYLKLTNEPELPRKSELEAADSSWANLPRSMNVRSMLDQIVNNQGTRLSYLYFLYRIASFDTHGKNLGTIGRSVFGKTANFPVLDINVAIDYMANQYLVILQDLVSADEI